MAPQLLELLNLVLLDKGGEGGTAHGTPPGHRHPKNLRPPQ